MFLHLQYQGNDGSSTAPDKKLLAFLGRESFAIRSIVPHNIQKENSQHSTGNINMKISIFLTILSFCVLQVLSKKDEKQDAGGAMGGVVGFFTTAVSFVIGTVVPMFTGSSAFSAMCDSAFDLLPFTEQCGCKASPSIFPPSATATVTCPVFDTCPDNVGFACGNCDLVIGAKGSITGPALDGSMGAKCTVDSPLLDFVKIEVAGGMGGGTGGFGIDSCKVSAGVVGFTIASCGCEPDPSCGAFGVTYTCSAAGIPLFSSGGCVALDSFRN